MRIAFDVKGTLMGSRGDVLAEAFRKLQDLGHECVVWSNLYSYATDAIAHHGLQAEAWDKMTKGDVTERGLEPFDVAIDDDRSQTWLGAKRFVWVDDLTNNSDAIVNLILKQEDVV